MTPACGRSQGQAALRRRAGCFGLGRHDPDPLKAWWLRPPPPSDGSRRGGTMLVPLGRSASVDRKARHGRRNGGDSPRLNDRGWACPMGLLKKDRTPRNGSRSANRARRAGSLVSPPACRRERGIGSTSEACPRPVSSRLVRFALRDRPGSPRRIGSLRVACQRKPSIPPFAGSRPWGSSSPEGDYRDGNRVDDFRRWRHDRHDHRLSVLGQCPARPESGASRRRR